MDNIRTIFYDMPGTIKAYTVFNDGYYTIVLNSALNTEMQKMAYYHELFHIKNGDFGSDLKSGLLEIKAHKGVTL